MKNIERVHKKNGKKWEKMGKKWEKSADFGSLFGEMEHNDRAATCEHNYAAAFSTGWERREHIVQH